MYTTTFSDYKGTIDAMRDALTRDILEVFHRHPEKDVTNNWVEACYETPVIRDSDNDDGIFTLDRISLFEGDLCFEASNSYMNETFSWVDVETLLEIRNEIIENEDDLFADEDE